MGHCRHFISRSRVRSSHRPSRGARVRVLVAVGAGLLLAACSAPAQPEGPPEIPEGVTGLAVRVSGLPVGEPAAVRVLREGITIAELDGSANLENIDVGTYSIEADDIGVAGSVYLANPPVQGAEVEAGASVKVEVAYTLQDPNLGSLKVELKGLPTGSRARVTLRGSSGKDQAQDGGPYVTFTNLEPGSYQVEAGAAAHGAATFEPDRSPISVVVGSAQSNATFDFACDTVDPPDPGLEAAFRDALGKQAGPLACSDVANMEYVDASARGIVDLEGLQYAGGLLTLNLDDNLLEALAPGHFASLERLKFLMLGANRIATIRSLDWTSWRFSGSTTTFYRRSSSTPSTTSPRSWNWGSWATACGSTRCPWQASWLSSSRSAPTPKTTRGPMRRALQPVPPPHASTAAPTVGR